MDLQFSILKLVRNFSKSKYCINFNLFSPKHLVFTYPQHYYKSNLLTKVNVMCFAASIDLPLINQKNKTHEAINCITSKPHRL